MIFNKQYKYKVYKMTQAIEKRAKGMGEVRREKRIEKELTVKEFIYLDTFT